MNTYHNRPWSTYQPVEDSPSLQDAPSSTVQLLPYHVNGSQPSSNPPYSHTKSRNIVSSSAKIAWFLGLVPTTILSTILLVATQLQRKTSGSFFRVLGDSRATVQIIVQILSNIFGLIHVTAISQLINYATRISLRRRPVSLDILRLWHGLSTAIIKWELPLKLLMPLMVYVTLAALPSALWAGALTPIDTFANSTANLNTPRYRNISSIKEVKNQYVLRNAKGLFTYNIGFDFISALLQSASTATPFSANMTRSHEKLDNSRFSYVGRSYGIGASVGLSDAHLTNDDQLLSYSYIDLGFNTSVTCLYNTTSDFKIEPVPDAPTQYVSLGLLPDSGPSQELSYYLGHDDSQIVALGVAHNFSGPVKFAPRYLSIAAGSGYEDLNQIQCLATFTPTQFEVSVAIVGRNITVIPTTMQSNVENLEPSGNLTHEATRQIALISQDETNLYHSTVGDAFESSISDFQASLPPSSSMTKQEITLAAVANSMTAMLDDILVAYSSAQLMIANDTVSVSVTLERQAIAFGQRIWIVGVFALNLIIVLLVAIEALRTRFWRDLVNFDYTDLPCLVVGSDALNHKARNVKVKVEEGGYGEHRLVRTV